MSEQFKNEEVESIDDIAVSWYLRLEAGMNKEEENLFHVWLRKSSKHEEAFNNTCKLFGKIDTLEKVRLEALKETQKQKGVNNTNFSKLALIACSVLILIFVGFFSQNSLLPNATTFQQSYSTAFAQKKEFELLDGSKIVLDSNSKIEVSFYENKRKINLLKGRVFFDVFHNKEQPFNIYSGRTRVKVLGTSFIVEYENNITKVAVKTGKVQVARLENKNTKKLEKGANVYFKDLLPGDSAVLSDSWDSPKFLEVNIKSLALWKDGRVEFDNTSLEEALKEFARYSKQIPLLEDESLKTLPVMGSFDLSRIDAFIQALEMTYDIKAINKNGQKILTQKN